MSPEFGMPPELELPLAENVFFVKSRVLAKLLNVPTAKLRSWEKSTDILKRSRNPRRACYTRGSALELIRYYRMSVESGEPLPKVWRRENGVPLRRTSAKPKPKPETGTAPLGSTGALSARKISEIAGVSRCTARRYRRRNSAPQAVVKLLSLYMRGRVLPESWSHTFINASGNLEFYGVGEVNENDAINFAWHEDLLRQQVCALEHDLAAAKKRIAVLEQELIDTREGVGGPNSANEREFFGRTGL